MIDYEPPNPSQFAPSTLVSDIKSECEDNADEYDTVERPVNDDDHDADMGNNMFNYLERRHQQEQRHQRLQSRSFYEEFRYKRSRSHDNISSSQSYTTPIANASSSNHCNNVSFVSTTTKSHGSNGNNYHSINSSPTASKASLPNDNETVSEYRPSSSHQHNFSAKSSMTHFQKHPQTIALKHHSNTITTSVSGAAAIPELCDCKTDPDVMFLMSLLPDIQKLNGRDRGKIKIVSQNIRQD